jgi:hypothetical protein
MNEFQEKVDQFKQTIQEPGFVTPESNNALDAEPTIGGDNQDNNIDEGQQEVKRPPAISKKKVESFRKRIDHLTYENKIRDAQNKELAAKVRYQEELLSETQRKLQENEEAKSAYYQENLDTREQSILSELKTAKEEGDIDKEIMLSKALADVSSAKSTYDLYKSQQQSEYKKSPIDIEPNYGQHYQEPYEQNYQDVYEQPENEELANWYENNPWADPNAPEFSPRLRQEVDAIAAEFEETLKYNKMAHLIGTPEYFDSINNIMNSRYGIEQPQRREQENDFYEYEEPARETYKSNYNVAPVSRNGSSMADQYAAKNPQTTRNSVALTEDEYKIARNLQIKLPNGRYMTGDEAVERYKKFKQQGAKGSSNRITID